MEKTIKILEWNLWDFVIKYKFLIGVWLGALSVFVTNAHWIVLIIWPGVWTIINILLNITEGRPHNGKIRRRNSKKRNRTNKENKSSVYHASNGNRRY